MEATVDLRVNPVELEAPGYEWDELARTAGATVFHTPAWALSWWSAFGDGKRLHVLEVRSGGRLVGLAPFCLERTRSRARRLKTLGSPEADYGGVLAAPGSEDAVADALATALFTDGEWDLLLLPEVAEEDQASRKLVDALRRKGCRIQEHLGRCHRILLPGSWEEYPSLLSRSTRKKILQKMRRLLELGAQVQPSHACRYGIQTLGALHTAQWAEKGYAGAFAHPRSARFHATLASRLAQQGYLDLCWLTVGASPQAAVYDFRFDRAVYSYLAAVNPDGLRHLSCGLVLTLWRIQAAIRDGYRCYDLLRGDEPYKHTLGARPFSTATYLVAHPGRWRAWWYLALAPVRDALLRRERPPHQAPAPTKIPIPKGGHGR